MKSEYLHIRISAELKEAAKKEAERRGLVMSEWVLDLIKAELIRRKGEAK